MIDKTVPKVMARILNSHPHSDTRLIFFICIAMKVCVNFHILQMVSSLLANVFAIRLSYFLPKTVLFFFFGALGF